MQSEGRTGMSIKKHAEKKFGSARYIYKQSLINRSLHILK